MPFPPLLLNTRHSLLLGYQATLLVVANCSDTEANAALMKYIDGLPSPRAPSHLFSPGHTCAVRHLGTLNTDNGYLMTSLMHTEPECALFVPSGFALKLPVTGARRLV
jgi:hypothetical protein